MTSRHNYKPVSISENYDNSDDDYEEDDFIQRQIQHQKLTMQKQDEGLSALSESASRLGALSLGISEELNQQNKMLDDMENDLERATDDLNMLSRKTKEFIQKSGGKRNFMIILGMSFVIVILLFLIIYT